MSKHIDAKGKNCPIPVVLAKQAIAEEESAFTIEVDNQTAVQNLTRLAASQCFDLTVQERDSAFILSFSKGDGVPTAPPIPTGNYAVFVGRDIIGSGDRELTLCGCSSTRWQAPTTSPAPFSS